MAATIHMESWCQASGKFYIQTLQVLEPLEQTFHLDLQGNQLDCVLTFKILVENSIYFHILCSFCVWTCKYLTFCDFLEHFRNKGGQWNTEAKDELLNPS